MKKLLLMTLLSLLFVACNKNKNTEGTVTPIDVEVCITNNMQDYRTLSFICLEDTTIRFFTDEIISGETQCVHTNENGYYHSQRPLIEGTYKWQAVNPHDAYSRNGTCTLTDGQTTSITVQ